MKHFTRVFLIVLALVLMSAWAFADAGSQTLSIQRLLVNDDGSISLIIHTTAAGELPASRFSLLVSGENVPVDEVQSYKGTDLGTTFLVLSDVSTVGATRGVKAVASGVIDQMDSDDNAGLMTNGYTSDQIDVSDGAVELKSLIEGDVFKRNNSARNLNETAGVALNFLSQHNAVKARACLVLLSSGENKDQTGMTTDELRLKIADSGVTVYTVTFKDESPSGQISTFESLARSSCGGTAITIRHGAGDSEFAEAVDQIRQQEQQFRMLTFVPGALAQAGGEITLTLEDSDYTLTDSVMLSAAQHAQYTAVLEALATPVPTAEPTPEPTAEPTPEPTAEPVPEPGIKDHLPLIIGGAAAVVVLAVVMISLKKKPKPEPEPQPEPQPEPIPDFIPDPEPQPVPIPARKPAVHVVLSPRAANERSYEGDMDHTMLIGRDHTRVDIVVNPNDSSISGMHLRLTYENGVMTAQDVSRNGTSVDNMRITAPTALRQNALLTMGRTSLYISWYLNHQ